MSRRPNIVSFRERTKLEDVLADIKEYAGDETLPNRDILLLQAGARVWYFAEELMNSPTAVESLLATIRVVRESSGPGKCSAEEALILATVGGILDLPEVVELARRTIKKGRADALGATAFLDAYLRARKESPNADLETALLGFAKRKYRREYHDLDQLAGTRTQEDRAEFEQSTRAFSRIDEDMWS